MIGARHWTWSAQMQMNSPQMKNIIKSRDNGPKKPCVATIRMISANNM